MWQPRGSISTAVISVSLYIPRNNTAVHASAESIPRIPANLFVAMKRKKQYRKNVFLQEMQSDPVFAEKIRRGNGKLVKSPMINPSYVSEY